MSRTDAAELLCNLWQGLDRLSVDDPKAYSRLIAKSAEECANAKEAPRPHKCYKGSAALPTGETAELHLNLLTWCRIPAPSSASASLSVCGGFIVPGADAVSVAVSPEAAHDADLLELVFDFVEDRSVGVRFHRSTWKPMSDKSFHGDLEEGIRSLKGEQGAMSDSNLLQMTSPSSLLSRLSSGSSPNCDQDATSPESISLSSNSTTGKKQLIKEIRSEPKSSAPLNDYEKRIRNTFNEKEEKEPKSDSIVVHRDETLLTASSSRRLRSREPVFGRKIVRTKDLGQVEAVVFKIYLPGVKSSADIFIQAEKNTLLLQSNSSWNARLTVLPDSDENTTWSLAASSFDEEKEILSLELKLPK